MIPEGAAELREKEAIAWLLEGHCYYVVRDGQVVDVIAPSQVRPFPDEAPHPSGSSGSASAVVRPPSTAEATS